MRRMICFASSRNNHKGHSQLMEELEARFPALEMVELVDFALERVKYPFVLFPCSGGVEGTVCALPLRLLEPPIYIFSIACDNSSAAATEISFNLRGLPHVLCSSLQELETGILSYSRLRNMIEQIEAVRLLEIGDYSSWLINEVDLKDEFLPKIERMAISDFLAVDVKGQKSSCESALAIRDGSLYSEQHLERSFELYNRLKTVLLNEQCSGVTVECFTLLEERNHYAACVPFAMLENEGYLAACEGEMSSLIGMVFLREVFGNEGIFMCNFLDKQGKMARFAHCTAPLCGLDACGSDNEYWLHTHYETGEGSCVTVELENVPVVVFKMRSDQKLFWLATGEVETSPGISDIEEGQCRTQVRIGMGERTPLLGNHHLICQTHNVSQIQTLKVLLNVYGFFEVRE